jgi:hypothetical protein
LADSRGEKWERRLVSLTFAGWNQIHGWLRRLEVIEQFDVTREQLSGHTVHTAQSRGWDTLSNGELLSAAEGAGFELLLTTDRRIRHQQNLRLRRIALVVLTGSTKWSRDRQHAERIAAVVASATPGSCAEVEIPFEP